MEKSCIRLSVKSKTEHNIFDTLWGALLSALYITALLLCLFTLTAADSICTVVLLLSAVITAACCFFLHGKRLRFLGFVLPLAVAAAVVLFSPNDTINGLYLSYNGVLDAIGEKTALIMPKLAFDSQGYALPFWLVLSSLLAMPVALAVHQKHSGILACVALAVILFCGYTGRINAVGVILLFISCAAMLMSRGRDYTAHSKRVFVQRTVSLVLCISVMLLTLAVLSPIDMSAVEKNTEQAINNARFGGSAVLPQGDFTKIKDLAPTDNAMLEVVMSKPDSYYLRGYVGEVYTQTGWKMLENSEKYKSADLFYTLHDSGFFGQTQLAAVRQAVEGESTVNTVTVKNIAASRAYVYAPYEVISADESILTKNAIGDTNLLASGFPGCKSYNLTAAENQVKRYTTLSSKLYDLEKSGDKNALSLLSLERYYNGYVYQSYLDMPSDTHELLKSLLGDFEADGEHLDYTKAKQKILTFLTSNCTYSEKANPCDGDFVTSFLLSNPKGYSVHFATAAVLMFRYYGIPARYVEGYLITPDDIKTAAPNTALTIDETHAHAWAEFYQDGVGWIPFEATPPYLNVMEKADDLSGVSADAQNAQNESQSTAAKAASQNQTVDEMLKQDEEQNTQTFVICITAALSLCLTAVIIFILWHILHKRRLSVAFGVADNTAAVKNMFAYSAKLLVKMRALEKPEDVYTAGDSFSSHFGEKYIKSLKDALQVYQKTVFGSKTPTNDERQIVELFAEETMSLYKNRRKVGDNK